MKSKILTILIILMSVSMWGQMAISIGSLTMNPSDTGSVINIPVMVDTGATGIGSFQFEIFYDPNVLSPVTQTPNNVGVSATCTQIPLTQVFSGAGSGNSLNINWLDATFMGISIASGTQMMTLEFTYLGGNSALTFNTATSIVYDVNFQAMSITLNDGEVALAPMAPQILTAYADSITSVSASLNGQVSASNSFTNVWFKYGTDTIYSDSIAATPDTISGFATTDVYANLSNLIPGTEYHFRLYAENSLGISMSDDVIFTTVPAQAPYAKTLGADTIGIASAFVFGQISANNATTDAFFEWGADTTYGMNSNVLNGPFYGQDTLQVWAELTGLNPNTIYHYRVGATNTEGTNYGEDSTFTANPELPYAEIQPAGNITLNSATLKGQVSANNSTTTVWFTYGMNGNYTDTIAATPAQLNGMDTLIVEANISGLTGNSSYSFKIIAENLAGISESQELTFSTNVSTAPTATTLDATNISSSDAFLFGIVNPGNANTTISFEYGLDNNYGQTINADPNTLNGNMDDTVMAQLTGLNPNSTYHYRLVATNSLGTTYGNDFAFDTYAQGEMAIRISTLPNPGNAGDTILVPVYVEIGADSIGSMQFQFNFDPAVLTPVEIGSLKIGITNEAAETLAGGAEWLCGTGSGNIVKPNWFDPSFNGIHLFSGTKLFDLIFVYQGGNSAITVDVAECVIYDTDYQLFNVSYLSGGVGTPPPAVIKLPVSDIIAFSATLNGTVNTFGIDTDVWFEYGTDQTYGDSILATPSMVNDVVDVYVMAMLSGLIEGQTYHFRLVAENLTGIGYGEDQSFTPVSINENYAENKPQIYSYESSLYINFPDVVTKDFSIQVMDLTGRIVHSEALNRQTNIEKHLNVVPGIYIVNLVSNTTIYTTKLTFR